MTESHPLRLAAARALRQEERAFLRTDRGSALYVSDLPRRGAVLEPILRALDAQDFDSCIQNGLLFITPRAAWISRLDEWVRPFVPADEQLRLLDRLAERAVSREDFSLWLTAVKLLERGNAEDDQAALDKRLRKQAAVCLRQKQNGGALAAARALWLYVNRSER